MKPQRVFPDPEELALVIVADLLSGDDVTVGISTPSGWSARTSPMHVLVAWDGTPRTEGYAVAWATIRVTVRGYNTGPVKALALRIQGLLAAQPMVKLLAGPTPSRDGDVEQASFTVRLTTRSQPLTG